MIEDHRLQKLALLAAKFDIAIAAHEEAGARAASARALDRALELEALEAGIEFQEIVRAWQAPDALAAAL
jgi:hypothetical protein